MNTKIRKVLIANRGEIALRIERAAQRLGIEAVVGLSELDAQGYVGRMAKEVAILGPAPVQESYTNIPRIIEVARSSGCDAVHPGYGFLSERADFAQAVQAAGLVWVGPPPAAIEALGSKTAARAVAAKAKVPTAAGAPGGLSDQQLAALADEVGYPVLLKAVAGGGGRGMRKAFSREELLELLPRARGEAKKNFGSDDIFFEQLILEPRHVEVQIFGDQHGQVVSFGTRDCSAQRKHQKVIEEGPAPLLSPSLRRDIEGAAVRIAEAVGYQNAGTAEFLVSGDRFFFLEMNTRIQVEHPVTEEVTGMDLVELQFLVAQGASMKEVAARLPVHAHAIELRLYAEDPERGYAPSLGVLSEVDFPERSWLRIERGVAAGDEISPFYDAMIAKLIVRGESRAQAVMRAQDVIRNISVRGIKTNQPFLAWLLHETSFAIAPLDITYIDRVWGAATEQLLTGQTLTGQTSTGPLSTQELPECVKKSHALLRRDPAHRPGSYELRESRKGPVAVAHEPEGAFLVRQVSAPHTAVRSNSLTAALRALAEETNP